MNCFFLNIFIKSHTQRKSANKQQYIVSKGITYIVFFQECSKTALSVLTHYHSLISLKKKIGVTINLMIQFIEINWSEMCDSAFKPLWNC